MIRCRPLQGILDEVGDRAKVFTMPWIGRLSQYEIIPSVYFFLMKRMVKYARESKPNIILIKSLSALFLK